MAVVSDKFIKEIQHFFVLPQLEISDHCKIVIHIDNVKKDNFAEEIKYDWIKLPSGYNYSDEDLQKYKMVFKNPEIEQDINVCKQLLEAGLIQPTGNKIQEIFKEAASFSLEINREKPERKKMNLLKLHPYLCMCRKKALPLNHGA